MSAMGEKRTLGCRRHAAASVARGGEFAERLSNYVERLQLRQMALNDSCISGEIFCERLDRFPELIKLGNTDVFAWNVLGSW